MDFASILSQEIAKASGKDASSSSSSPSSSSAPADSAPAKKYISRREAEEARRAAYLAEQKRLEEERAAKAAAKRRREEEAAEEARQREEKRRRLAEETRRRREAKEAEEERARRKRLGLPELPPAPGEGDEGKKKNKAEDEADDVDDDDDADDDAGKLEDLPEEELTRRLRALGEPARLFAEEHAARLRRYRRAARGGDAGSAGPIVTTLRAVEEKDMKVPSEVPPASDKKARRFLFRQLASWFNLVLREWEVALAKEDNADTFAGQAARRAMVQSKETMRPLFRKFEKGDLDEDILKALVEIVGAAQERRYVDANDGYLRLSIGKAAWPIGVTMVGIHERSAREKLHDGERGHIMRSEVTRKYLQSIKRCLTFAQVRWPPEDIRQLMG
ncbi:hypothetical protein VTJ83DRAFT_979 [Remersonia thermophila]|uniref:Pre-mRNA-splicing factor 18 n=1 Tax=Remersonia thermophila TaxID=72144 RepID=A0ABR4DMW2_9PEZI